MMIEVETGSELSCHSGCRQSLLLVFLELFGLLRSLCRVGLMDGWGLRLWCMVNRLGSDRRELARA